MFSIFESASPSLSIAQKFAISPAVPNIHLKSTLGKLFLLILNFSSLFARRKIARKRATRFLKKAFSIVGRSPASLRNIVISENENAARMICMIPHIIPLLLGLLATDSDVTSFVVVVSSDFISN